MSNLEFIILLMKMLMPYSGIVAIIWGILLVDLIIKLKGKYHAKRGSKYTAS